MDALLVLALTAPVVGAIVTRAWPERSAVVVRGAAIVAAGLWLLLLLDGSTVSVGPVHSAPVVAAAALGCALVVAGSDRDGRPAGANRVCSLALGVVAAGLAAGQDTTHAAGLMVGIGAGAALAFWAERTAGPDHASRLLTGAAVAVGAAGAFAVRSAAEQWTLPVGAGPVSAHRFEGGLLLAAAAALVLAGSRAPRRAVAMLVPAGLLLAAGAAPLVRGLNGQGAVALLLALLACIAALAARAGRPVLDRPSASLALLSMAAFVGPGATRPAGFLLAGAAALAAAFGTPAAAVFGVPGLVALAVALGGHGGAVALFEGVLAGATALALAAAAVRAPVVRPTTWAAPALVIGAWLLVAPGSWAWAGPTGLRAYDLGAARAAAAAALVLAAVTVRDRVPAGWYARRAPEVMTGEDVDRH